MSKSGFTASAEPQRLAVDAKHGQLAEVTPHLNTKLHQRILAEGTAKPSTYESAVAALARIRAQRATVGAQPPAE